MRDIEKEVKEAIRDHLGLSALPERGDNMRDDCGADSLDGIELAIELEQVFDIEIDDGRLEGLETVGAWIDLVDELVKEAA